MKTFLVTALLSISTQAFSGEAFHPSVEAAHQAYLKKDGSTLLNQTKEALIQHKNHPLVVANLMGLYGAAQKNGLLTGSEVDWKLPREVEYLKVEVHRRYFSEAGKVVFFMTTFGSMTLGQELEQFQIIRYPNQVTIDKAGKIGEWDDETYDGRPSFWAAGSRSAQPVEEGLYLLNIQIKNQPMVQGWFLLADVNSSASPVVTAPKLNQSFSSGQPAFGWKSFHSPEYKPGERVNIGFKVAKEVGNSYDELVEAELDSKLTGFTVGDKSGAKEYTGISLLAPGAYQFTLSYREQSRFGDLIISRGTSTKVPFSILP